MDADRFDALARGIARAASRRTLLRTAALALAAPLARPAEDAAAKRQCSFSRCGGRRRCCSGLTCCGGDCVDLTWNQFHCGACGTACDLAGETCRDGACSCLGPSCGDACCGADEACLDPGASACGECPAGGTLEDGAACGLNPEFYDPACTCVTSVDGVTVCTSGWGVCVDCESDRECTLALGAQAVCVPAAGPCARWRATRACVEAACFGGDMPSPGETTPAGRVVRLGR